MTLDPITSPLIAPAAAARQLETMLESQVSMLKELADQQNQVSRMLTENGLGKAIDIMA